MPCKPHFNGRDSDKGRWQNSVEKICDSQPDNIVVYPGHGNLLTLGEWKENNKLYL
jgi:glyoxylase-like metal-dependent hydrolase (beta-lactamase superfamily II)